MKPSNPSSRKQEKSLRVIKGEDPPPKYGVVKDWLRFLKEYPEIDRD
jgi:hypothetical protein